MNVGGIALELKAILLVKSREWNIYIFFFTQADVNAFSDHCCPQKRLRGPVHIFPGHPGQLMFNSSFVCSDYLIPSKTKSSVIS